MKAPFQLARATIMVGGALGLSMSAQSGQLTIATDPLGTGTTSIKPNIMFILDDSGSMGSDYMPDYLIDSQDLPASNGDTSYGTASCFDAGDDSSGTITGNPDGCIFGDPPYNSSDINTIYYNPDIRYRPAVNADGTEMNAQTSANTTGWTAVPSNPFLSSSTTNLLTGYQDRVWCTSPGDTPGGTGCRPNASYQYPSSAFPYGADTSGSVKYVSGSPYYYRAKTAQWCSDSLRTSTGRPSSAPTPS
jgi:type IV pilus assembly protein PilY1